jgi:peptidyl-prolyl cis-trans isomerase D
LAERFYQAIEEQRVVQSKVFDPNNFLASSLPSEQQIADDYAKNSALYETLEQADLEYLVLSAETLAQQINISKEDVANFYKANQGKYQMPEQRRASHILISFGDDKTKAKTKAAEILAKVRTAPESFAALAQQFSDDSGSKEKGGDLDFFGRGAMVPPFEAAVFKLKTNEISDLVESDFGFHIIRLTDLRAGKTRTLDEVSAEIEKELRQQQASKRYAEAASQFTDLVYEQADSLQPAAEKLALTIQKFTG